jgi:predicted transcriptional regulator
MVRHQEAASIYNTARRSGKSVQDARQALAEWVYEKGIGRLEQVKRKDAAFVYMYGAFTQRVMP